MKNTNISPDQLQKAKSKLSQFLGHDVISEKEAYRLLRALEVATVMDLAGKSYKITDKNQLFLRTALQNKRDSYQWDFSEYSKDSYQEITDPKKSKDFNWEYYRKIAYHFVSSHLELRFGQIWSKQNYKFQKSIADEFALSALSIIRKIQPELITLCSGISSNEQEIIKSLSNLPFMENQEDTFSIFSAGIPFVAEAIFKKRFNKVKAN